MLVKVQLVGFEGNTEKIIETGSLLINTNHIITIQEVDGYAFLVVNGTGNFQVSLKSVADILESQRK